MVNNLIQQNIPKGWQVKTVDDVALVFKGKGLSKGEINPSGKNKCILYGQLFTTYNEIIKEIQSKTDCDESVRSQRGDILVPGSTTTNARDLAVASVILEDGVLLGGDINILRKKDNLYDPAFLAYYLTHYKKDEIGSFGQGITIVHLYGRDIKKIKLILPTIPEQENIVEILTTVDEEIQKTDEIILQTEKMKKGLMRELFTKGIGHKKFKKTKIGEIPEEWENLKLDDVFKLTSGKGLSKKYFIRGEFSVYGGNGVSGMHSEYFLENSNIIIGRVGEYCGAVHLTKPKSWVTDNALYIDHFKREVIQMFLFYLLFWLDLNQYAKIGGQPSISQDTVGSVDVGFPQLEEQKKIAEILLSVDEKILVNKNFKEKLSQLKKGLTQDLLSGKVRVK